MAYLGTSTRSKITGLDEVKAVFRQLPDAMQKRALGSAVRAGANLIKRAVIDKAPRGTEPPHWKYGRLHENISIRTERGASGDRQKMFVHTGRAYWSLFLEFGTRFMGARAFMRPALYENANAAIREIGVALGKAVEREAKRLAGPYAKVRKVLMRSGNL